MTAQKIEISNKSIIFTILFLLSLCLLWQLKSVLVLFFFCLLLMEIFNPIIMWLEKFKMPRALAIVILYIIFISVFSFALAGIVPIFIAQTDGFIKALPSLVRSLSDVKIFGGFHINLSNQLNFISNTPTNITKTAVNIFSNIFSTLLVFVITFYLLLERKNVEQYAGKVFGDKGTQKSKEFLLLLEKRLGHWLNGQLLLMLVVGILTYIGFLIIGLHYALPLAILAALFEILPNIGPTITTVLAAIVGLTISPIVGLMAIIVGLIVNQLENGIIVPKIMKESIGLKPVLTLFILIAGAKLGGVGGAVLSIPIYLTLESIYKVFIEK